MPANPDRSYPTQAEAEAAARKMGCSGAHQANGGWMPCATHRIYQSMVGGGAQPTRLQNGEREVGIRGVQTLPDGGLASAPQNGPFGGKAGTVATDGSWQQLGEWRQMMGGDDDATPVAVTPSPSSTPTEGASTMDLVQQMRGLLSDVVTVYFRAHGYHWNVEGEDFSQYHALFAEIYGDIYDSIDVFAEILRKLDAYAPFTLAGFIAARSIDDSRVSTDPKAMASDLLDANEQLIKVLMATFTTANSDNQQGVANFIAERIDMHQKWSWQLRSSVK